MFYGPNAVQHGTSRFPVSPELSNRLLRPRRTFLTPFFLAEKHCSGHQNRQKPVMGIGILPGTAPDRGPLPRPERLQHQPEPDQRASFWRILQRERTSLDWAARPSKPLEHPRGFIHLRQRISGWAGSLFASSSWFCSARSSLSCRQRFWLEPG